MIYVNLDISIWYVIYVNDVINEDAADADVDDVEEVNV